MVSYDQFASALLTKYQIPGTAIAVARNGKLVFARGYGYANKATGELVQPDSQFRIASLAKPITSAAILLLVQRGKLTLDQRVFDVLSYEPLPGETVDPRLPTITIRNLLEHSGGWNRETTFDPMFLPLPIAVATGTPAPATTDSIIHYMMGKPLQFNPGTEYNYSNFGYVLLGRVIETITGQPYEKFVREQVLSPSGAACMHIGHSLQAQSLPKEVKYYDFPGAPLVPSIYGNGTLVARPDGGFHLEAMDSHGGWVASTIDYLRFVLSVDGRNDPPDILPAATIKTMIARPAIPSWAPPAPSYYAKGWQVAPAKGGDANWWHLGNLAGTSTIVVRNSAGVTWAAFFNGAPSNWTTFIEEVDSGMWAALAGVTAWPSSNEFESFAPCVAGSRRRAVHQ
ncbi:MAG TPA: serine hydrolase domain-containing protein [Thermoanaerobaculia bacterium]|nr:serine hydrolase domain-containing protein [Thermoanaerobaculia bacterium]